MKANEVHKLSIEEIDTEVKRIRAKLFELRSQSVTEKLENPRQIGVMRRDVARLKTEKRSRQLREVNA